MSQKVKKTSNRKLTPDEKARKNADYELLSKKQKDRYRTNKRRLIKAYPHLAEIEVHDHLMAELRTELKKASEEALAIAIVESSAKAATQRIDSIIGWGKIIGSAIIVIPTTCALIYFQGIAGTGELSWFVAIIAEIVGFTCLWAKPKATSGRVMWWGVGALALGLGFWAQQISLIDDGQKSVVEMKGKKDSEEVTLEGLEDQINAEKRIRAEIESTLESLPASYRSKRLTLTDKLSEINANLKAMTRERSAIIAAPIKGEVKAIENRVDLQIWQRIMLILANILFGHQIIGESLKLIRNGQITQLKQTNSPN